MALAGDLEEPGVQCLDMCKPRALPVSVSLSGERSLRYSLLFIGLETCPAAGSFTKKQLLATSCGTKGPDVE